MFDGPAPGQTPASIAAGVRRSGAHQVAEAALAEARARRTAIGQEMRELIGRSRDGANDALLRTLDREKTAIGESMHALREKARAGRVAHSIAVRGALRPITAAAATRAYEAALALREAVGVLDQVNDQLLRAHGEPFFVPHFDIDPMLRRMGRLSGRAD